MTGHTTPPPDFGAEHTLPLPAPLGQPYGGPAPEPLPQKKSKKHLIGYPATAIIALAIGAAGGGDANNASPIAATPTVTITQTVATPQVAETVTETVRETVSSTAPAPVVSSPSEPSKPAGKITVPNGVGMNYQDAQDAWRAAGLIVAPATDATGANRLPVIDSNWIVLSQDLEPGTKVDADSFITATVKKSTDN